MAPCLRQVETSEALPEGSGPQSVEGAEIEMLDIPQDHAVLTAGHRWLHEERKAARIPSLKPRATALALTNTHFIFLADDARCGVSRTTLERAPRFTTVSERLSERRCLPSNFHHPPPQQFNFKPFRKISTTKPPEQQRTVSRTKPHEILQQSFNLDLFLVSPSTAPP
ncbi:hypothetical protein KM043_011995 [Ampulex compressa]|nr:hypothetical protein KM043_011995 [Ampulex compressa]